FYYWEWHAESDYSDAPLSTSPYYTINSGPGEQYTLYLRGRRQPTGSWTSVGQVTFVDPRNAV
ncbi:MAG TPA: hypothetical protein VJQ25_02980, partial [Nitrospira sp.]|nr:hypothetical protein [Nitrospira sp.]